jgi:hypothetical protein
MRQIALTVSLLALSITCRAGPIMAPAPDVIDVEVWGSVDRIIFDEGLPKVQVGDSVHRRMRIDLSLTPPDRDASTDGGIYQWNVGCDFNCPPRVDAPSGFVTTAGSTFDFVSEDSVQVSDHGGFEGRSLFKIDDVEDDGRGFQGNFFALSVTVLETMDFIQGDGLVQSFDIRPESELHSRGHVTMIKDAVRNSFGFLVERIRVTPKVCKA